jgi:uncharacterized membrane protein
MLNRLRDLLIDGILMALPIAAVVYLAYQAVGLLLKVLAPVSSLMPQARFLGIAALDIAAIVALIALLIVLGAIGRSAPGRRLAQSLERIVLTKIPGYLIIKSVLSDLSDSERDEGLQPALVTFDDNTVLGFVVEPAGAGGLVTVFIPDAPASSSGSVALVQRERVRVLDVATGGAMRTMKQRGLGLQQLAHKSGAPAAGPKV